MKHSIKIVSLIIVMSIYSNLKAQVKIGSNPSTIGAGSLLELESTSKALTLPRLTTTQMNAIPSPTNGMVIYNTTAGCIYQRNASSWVNLCTDAAEPHCGIVWFNTVNPSLGGPTFTPNTPANTCKMYISSVDGSTWGYNGTSYATKTYVVEPWWNYATKEPSGSLTDQLYHLGSVNIGTGFTSLATNYSLTVGRTDTITANSSIAVGASNYVGNTNSMAIGLSNRLTQTASASIGTSNSHTANTTYSIGGSNSLSAVGGIAFGSSNTVSGLNAACLGSDNRATNQKSIAIGDSDTSSGRWSIAIGRRSRASHDVAIAIGTTCVASAANALSMGQNCVASGTNSTAIGENNNATGTNSTTLGNGSTASHTNAMVLGNSGTSSAANQMTMKFTSGYRLFTNTGETTGALMAAGNSTWSSVSDRRAKENITPLNMGLSTVMKLNPSSYTYKNHDKLSYGFIAQEVQEIIPALVEVPQDENAMLSIRYTELIPILTKAIQELKLELDAKSALLDQSNDRFASLESQLQLIQTALDAQGIQITQVKK